MVLAGIPNPQLRLQRNDHCKSHSVSLSCKLSHGCHRDRDGIVKAILFSVGFDHGSHSKSHRHKENKRKVDSIAAKLFFG